MPHHREHNRQRGEYSTNGSKQDTDFNGFMFGDQIGRQVLKDVLQFPCAGSRIISAAGHACDLSQRSFVYSAPESTASELLPSASAKLTAAGLPVVQELLAAIWEF